MLMGELEQLLTLVKQKETEITNNDYNLEVVKNKINKIVSRFKEMQSSIQQGITSFKQMIIFIDKRVLKLELEKKVASAVRNFKEVARIAIKAKSLCVEKESIKIDIDTTTLNLELLGGVLNVYQQLSVSLLFSINCLTRFLGLFVLFSITY